MDEQLLALLQALGIYVASKSGTAPPAPPPPATQPVPISTGVYSGVPAPTQPHDGNGTPLNGNTYVVYLPGVLGFDDYVMQAGQVESAGAKVRLGFYPATAPGQYGQAARDAYLPDGSLLRTAFGVIEIYPAGYGGVAIGTATPGVLADVNPTAMPAVQQISQSIQLALALLAAQPSGNGN